MTDSNPATLQESLLDQLKNLNELYDKILTVTQSAPYQGAIASHEMKAQNPKPAESAEFTAGDYECFLANKPQSRMMSAQQLLYNRIDHIKETKKKVTLLDLERTHTLPLNYHFKPSVQLAENIVTFTGNICHGTCILAGSNHKFYYDEALWDFKLLVDGTFTDDDLEFIHIEVNGMYFDKYRRILYSKPTQIPGTSKYSIPLDFWMKTIDRAAFLGTNTTFNVQITKVPDTVKSIVLLARRVVVDRVVADIYNKTIGFYPAQVHMEEPLDTRITFRSKQITVHRYGLYSPDKPIYQVLESVNGVPIDSVIAMQGTTLADKYIQFNLPSPIAMENLIVNVTRKTADQVIFVADPTNFILVSDGCMMLRYVY